MIKINGSVVEISDARKLPKLKELFERGEISRDAKIKILGRGGLWNENRMGWWKRGRRGRTFKLVKEKILEVLRDGGWLSSIEIASRLKMSKYSPLLHSALKELVKKGIVRCIERRWRKSKSVRFYRLVER